MACALAYAVTFVLIVRSFIELPDDLPSIDPSYPTFSRPRCIYEQYLLRSASITEQYYYAMILLMFLRPRQIEQDPIE
jgi:hypothetical protein